MMPERSSIRTCSSADGSVLRNGSTNLETDIAPPRLSRAIIRRRNGKPSASSMSAVFFRASPRVYERARSREAATFCAAHTVSRCSRSLTRFILLGFQYLVINLSIGIFSWEVEAGVWLNDVLHHLTRCVIRRRGRVCPAITARQGAHAWFFFCCSLHTVHCRLFI